RKIFISIIGKEQTRRAFLAVIRSAFDEINGNFKIEIKQMIPVPGTPHALVSYKDLLVLEEMNEQEIVMPELRQKINIRQLLEGAEDTRDRMERRERDLYEGRFLRHMPEEIKPSESLIQKSATAQPAKHGLISTAFLVLVVVIVLLAALVGAAIALSK